MLQQGISLPPQVQGSSKRGSLEIIFSSLVWTSTSKPRPEHLFARITWWGDVSSTNHDVPLYNSADTATNSSSSIEFPLVSSAAHIARYLNDMAVLEINILQVEAAPKSIAKVCINTAAIANAGLATFNEAAPVVSLKNEAVLGSLKIKLNINYRPSDPATSTTISMLEKKVKDRVEKTAGREVDAASLKNLNQPAPSTQDTAGLNFSAINAIDSSNIVDGTASSDFEQHIKASADMENPDVAMVDTPAIAASLHTANHIAASTSAAAAATATAAAMPPPEEQEIKLPGEGEYAVLVRVDSAFELPSPSEVTLSPTTATSPVSSSSSLAPSSFVYASVVWQRDRSQRANTHLTASQEVPLTATLATSSSHHQTDCGTSTQNQQQQRRHAAVWRSELELKVDIQPFIAAATAFSGKNTQNTVGILDGPLLLINVWRSGIPTTDPIALLERLHLASSMEGKKGEAVATPFDQLIGCAAVDLSSFIHPQLLQPIQAASTRQLEGKFPLVNAQHQVQGVVKASVMPNTHLNAALDAINNKNEGGTAATIENVDAGGGQHRQSEFFTTRETVHQSQQGRKQEYAWSGSDSDDGDAMAMVGMSFEGAVSCSDPDEDEEDYYLQQNSSKMDVERQGEERKALKLINHDWMFDICKHVGPQEEETAEEDGEQMDTAHGGGGGGGGGGGDINFSFVQHHQAQEQVVKEKKAVVFKNRLLPGVVMTARQVDYVIASDFGGTGSGSGGHGGGTAAVAEVGGGALPILPPQGARGASPRHIAHHHPELNNDWLFGIGNQQQQQQPEQQPEQQQQRRRPPPPEVTANQFAPMTRKPT